MQSRNETNRKPEAEKRQQMKMAEGCPPWLPVTVAAAVHIKTEIIAVRADGHAAAAIGTTAAVGGSTLANTFATALVIKST